MNVSAEFLQQVRDECYGTSLRCLEATDFIGEHQEIPIINFCKANYISPDDLSFEQQAAIFNNTVDRMCADAEFFAGVADELDKQAYMKTLIENGLKNIPSNRTWGLKHKCR